VEVNLRKSTEYLDSLVIDFESQKTQASLNINDMDLVDMTSQEFQRSMDQPNQNHTDMMDDLIADDLDNPAVLTISNGKQSAKKS